MSSGRSETTISRVQTVFGTMYIQVDVDLNGRPVGGNISTHKKEPDSQISKLIEELSDGLRCALGGNND